MHTHERERERQGEREREREREIVTDKLWTAVSGHQLGVIRVEAGEQPCASKRVDILMRKAVGACGERGSMPAVFVSAAPTDRRSTIVPFVLWISFFCSFRVLSLLSVVSVLSVP
jgi:hypothetical protein